MNQRPRSSMFKVMTSTESLMRLFTVIVVAVSCLTVSAQFDNGFGDDESDIGLENSAASLVIEHSLDEGVTWTPRATINLRSLKTDNAIINHLGPLSSEDRRKFKVLLKSNGVYKLRAPSRLTLPSNAPSTLGEDIDPNDEAARYVSTFVRACALFDASLNDRVTIHLGQGADVIGISLLAFPPNHGCSIRSPDDVDENLVADRLMQWSTEVGVSHMTQGPAPDTLTFVQKMEREAAERAKGQQADNRSFFAKYWMYIVPAVILLVMQSAAAPAEGG